MKLAATLVAWVGLLVAAPGLEHASAQPAQDKSARELHEAAQKAYDVSKFAEAVELWTAAYEKDPRPGFLFNIGRAHMNNADCKSVRFFDRFIKVAGKSSQVPMARDLVEKERARCGKKQDKAKGLGELGEKAMSEGQCGEAAGYFRDQLDERKLDDFNEASKAELVAISDRIAAADACVTARARDQKSLEAAEDHRIAGRCREAIVAFEAHLEAREGNAALPLTGAEREGIEQTIAELRADPCSQKKPATILGVAKLAVRLQGGAAVLPIRPNSTTTQSMVRLGAGYLVRLGRAFELEVGATFAEHLVRATGKDPHIVTTVAHARLGYIGAAQMQFGIEASGGVAGAFALGEGNPFVVFACDPAEPDCSNASGTVWMPYLAGGIFVDFAVTRRIALGLTATFGRAVSSSPEIDLTPLVGVTGGISLRF